MAGQGKVPNGQFHNRRREMIDKKYDAEIDAVLDAVAVFPKGTTVPWTVIQQAMGRHRDEVGGWTIIRRVRRRLLRDRQVACLPDPTVGLRLLSDMEAATEIPELRQRKARRQIARGLRETDAIDTSQLTKHASIALAMSRKHMKAERLALSRAKREVESLTKPTRSAMAAR
jgi:hypothetical protein